MSKERLEATGSPVSKAWKDWEDGQPRPFRKRPVVIEAARLGEYNGAGVAAWCGGVLRGGPGGGSKGSHVIIPTLEGRTVASPGDFVIRGVAGEFYACKPEIFAATYEPVLGEQHG